ncbi:MAG TPA: ABC transporter substrate-binding protein, partial [Symbiobacteriaceae bacterium]|nr:ABC transporter substrate-binding protein [Symbiobacteriaceae bacterium]
LIAQNQPDLLVGAAGPQGLDLLRPLLAQTGTVFIAVDSGANAVRKSEYSPWVFYQTLGYWHAGWAAGQWAARHLGGRAFAASSFFESGYDALASFQVSFEAAGGTVLQTSVTHVPPDPFDWQTLFAAIRGARPDFVYALYGGDLAVAFVQAYAASGLAETIPLMGAPSLVDEALLPQQGAAALGLRSCHTFLEPDGFATLGCETAHMIVGALAGAGDAGGIAAALREVRITGPRGRLRMQPTTQSVSMPVYLREVRQGASGVRNEVIAALGMVAEDDPRLAPLTEGLRTGWLHAHLG